jgi:hypothetical protein
MIAPRNVRKCPRGFQQKAKTLVRDIFQFVMLVYSVPCLPGIEGPESASAGDRWRARQRKHTAISGPFALLLRRRGRARLITSRQVYKFGKIYRD